MDQATASAMLDSWVATVNRNPRDGDGKIYPIGGNENLSALQAATDSMETPAMINVTGDQPVPDQQAELYEIQQTTGPTSQESVRKMVEAPATGLMHISDIARISSGWNPVLLDNSAANSVAYQNYLNKIVSFPLVTLNYASRETLRRTTSDWNTLIESIADTFVGIQGDDKEAIVRGLKNLAQAATSTSSTEQKTSLFCQNAINTGDGIYEFFLYNSTCTFKEETGKGWETRQNDFDVLKVKLTLILPLWTEENVAKIIGQTSQSLDDWVLDTSTSLAGTSPIPALEEGTP